MAKLSHDKDPRETASYSSVLAFFLFLIHAGKILLVYWHEMELAR